MHEREIVHKEVETDQKDFRKTILKCTRCNFKAKGAIELKFHLIQNHGTENMSCDWEKYFRAYFSMEILICSVCKDIFSCQKELKNHTKLHESQDSKIEVTLSEISIGYLAWFLLDDILTIDLVRHF